MTDFLDKLLEYNKNKYVFAKAAMNAIGKIGNIRDYPEESTNKTVSNILTMILNDKIKYQVEEIEEKDKEKE